jgi:hypothetical protein
MRVATDPTATEAQLRAALESVALRLESHAYLTEAVAELIR